MFFKCKSKQSIALTPNNLARVVEFNNRLHKQTEEIARYMLFACKSDKIDITSAKCVGHAVAGDTIFFDTVSFVDDYDNFVKITIPCSLISFDKDKWTSYVDNWSESETR